LISTARIHVWRTSQGWCSIIRHRNGRLSCKSTGYNKRNGAIHAAVKAVGDGPLPGQIVNGRPPPEKKRKAMKKKTKSKPKRPC